MKIIISKNLEIYEGHFTKYLSQFWPRAFELVLGVNCLSSGIPFPVACNLFYLRILFVVYVFVEFQFDKWSWKSGYFLYHATRCVTESGALRDSQWAWTGLGEQHYCICMRVGCWHILLSVFTQFVATSAPEDKQRKLQIDKVTWLTRRIREQKRCLWRCRRYWISLM